MKKSDIKSGAKVKAKDIETEEEHSGQIVKVDIAGYAIQWDHENEASNYRFNTGEHELIELI